MIIKELSTSLSLHEIFETFLEYDHCSKKTYIFIIDLYIQNSGDIKRSASDFVTVVEERIKDKEKNKYSEKNFLHSEARARARVTHVVSKKKYIDMIEKAKEYKTVSPSSFACSSQPLSIPFAII